MPARSQQSNSLNILSQRFSTCQIRRRLPTALPGVPEAAWIPTAGRQVQQRVSTSPTAAPPHRPRARHSPHLLLFFRNFSLQPGHGFGRVKPIFDERFGGVRMLSDSLVLSQRRCEGMRWGLGLTSIRRKRTSDLPVLLPLLCMLGESRESLPLRTVSMSC